MITDVIILSRTKMAGDKICVGGLDLKSGGMLRLLDDKASALTKDYPYKIGETYTIEFAQRYNRNVPHLEDVAVYEFSLTKTYNKTDLDTAVYSNSASLGDLRDLFSGKLQWNNNKGYALQSDPPNFSVQIAQLNRTLIRNGADYQEVGSFTPRRVKYVGEMDISRMPPRINSGTPIRFSLARPWDKDGNGVKVCYLQLSGIYI
ncbi:MULTISPECIES: dual OB domain-containing protein [unclassified Pseudocitrobacter]|uniref:dual OB domain-containing protein n=1 Tax=unclassified Pseudocitrobacter TaxID=2638778 RepID=UPI0023E4305B|nr:MULTISPECIES: hypothetical protein [unclassified Pseudocitrobacter]MDF3827818.1 hypothetical protein [Pseudocitrobacter sp. 2023EL-00150]MEC5373635.1 hypothetical protein [Pseudocitrobacter sp. MW920760]